MFGIEEPEIAEAPAAGECFCHLLESVNDLCEVCQIELNAYIDAQHEEEPHAWPCAVSSERKAA